MSTFESDDLLLKSQMLISKFRKQREVALKQKTPFNENISTAQKSVRSDYCAPNNIQKVCDSYPHREMDNILLNKFMNQHYFSQSINESHLTNKNDCNQNSSENIELLSENESSIWSASSPTQKEIKMIDCGIMTDIQDFYVYNDEIITPVTTLPPTFRNYSEINRFCKVELGSNQKTSKKSTFICTEFKNRDSCSDNIMTKNDKSMEISNEKKLKDLNEDSFIESNEEDKMNAAWEYFQEEKTLEKRINKQTELLDKLNRDMDDLRLTVENETRKLDEMTKEKEKFRMRRYGIFNGLSKEIQKNETKPDVKEFDINDTNKNTYDVSNSYLNYQDLERNDLGIEYELKSPLDSVTVRNIINKIVCKEFCNSEDKIFDKILSNPIRMFGNGESKSTITHESGDDCVLSDVLSIKDLNIISSSIDNETKTSNNTMTSSVSILNNTSKINEQKPPKLKKKLRSAHSADNIIQIVSNSKLKRRKNVRSPSISVDLKRYLHDSSSSDESIFEASIYNRYQNKE